VTALNAYTGQNPRQLHVVLKKTSQRRTICTQTRRDLSACLYLHVSFSPGGGIEYIFVDIFFTKLLIIYQRMCGSVTKFMILKFIITKFICNKIIHN
jgi:hypothetical protein